MDASWSTYSSLFDYLWGTRGKVGSDGVPLGQLAEKVAIPPSRAPWRVPSNGAVPKELGPSVIWNLHKIEDVQPDIETKAIFFRAAVSAPEGIGPTRYATMEMPRLARLEGCCDSCSLPIRGVRA